MSEIPADVRAAAIRFHELECEIAGKPQAWDDISPESQMVAETFAREMIAASDRARVEAAGDVAKSLRDMAGMSVEGGNADPLIEVIQSLGHQAANLIAALDAENERLRALARALTKYDLPPGKYSFPSSMTLVPFMALVELRAAVEDPT